MAKNTNLNLPRGIDLRSDGYRARLMRNGTKLTRTFDTLAEAIKWKEIMAGRLTGDTYEDRSEEKNVTLEQLLDKYLREVTPHKRGWKAETNRINAWKRQEWARWSVTAVTSRQITEWRNARVAAGKAPTTISNALNLLSKVFKTARGEWAYKIDNPCVGIARPKQRAPRDAPPEDKLEALLLAKARAGDAAWLAPFITIAAWTAMRQGEIRQLRWEFVDFEQKLFRLPASVTKAKKPRGVVMLPVVEKCLRDWLAGADKPKKGLVFHRPITELEEIPRCFTDNGVSIAFHRLVEQVFKRLEGNDREDMQRITFHDLRHWGCTRLAPFHRDAVDLSKTTGHEKIQQLARYFNEKAEDRAARVLKLVNKLDDAGEIGRLAA